jgi:hypothetical protein
MSEFMFTIPIVPGKEGLDRQTLDTMVGSRRDEFEGALREAGLRRQMVWHQQTPDGTVAVVYLEGDDAAAGMQQFSSSDAPFNTWFRDQMKEVHGVDISAGSPQVEKVQDFSV